MGHECYLWRVIITDLIWRNLETVEWTTFQRLERDLAPVTAKPINWFDDEYNDYYVSYFWILFLSINWLKVKNKYSSKHLSIQLLEKNAATCNGRLANQNAQWKSESWWNVPLYSHFEKYKEMTQVYVVFRFYQLFNLRRWFLYANNLGQCLLCYC